MAILWRILLSESKLLSVTHTAELSCMLECRRAIAIRRKARAPVLDQFRYFGFAVKRR